MVEITIKMNKQDVKNWLNDPEIDRIDELVELYALTLANKMAEFNPGSSIIVELCDVYRHNITVKGIDDWEKELDLLEELELDLDRAEDYMAQWEWLPEWA